MNAANGLSVNGLIKIGLQKDKSNVCNVCEPGGSVIVCIYVLLLEPLCVFFSYLVL